MSETTIEAVELSVVDASGKSVGKKSVSSEFAAEKITISLLHQVVRWQRAKRRAGTHSVKTRAEVAGGGVKPWKQKGTGRARAGSNTSPLWVGGGVAHGPKPRSYEFRLNKKEKRAALSCAVSQRRLEGRLIVVDSFGLSGIKTKAAKAVLSAVGVKNGAKTLVVVPSDDMVLEKSLRNLANVKVIQAGGLNVYDVLHSEFLVFVGEAVTSVDERLNGAQN